SRTTPTHVLLGPAEPPRTFWISRAGPAMGLAAVRAAICWEIIFRFAMVLPVSCYVLLGTCSVNDEGPAAREKGPSPRAPRAHSRSRLSAASPVRPPVRPAERAD